MTKGQYIRLLVSTTQAGTKTVIGAAKELTLHVSSQVEESSTKDTTGEWLEQEVVGLTYDISSMQLVLTDDDTLLSNGLATMQAAYKNGTLLYWQIANMSGTNNRTKGAVICSGTGYVTQLTINAQNRQNATCQVAIGGKGAMTVGS